VDVFTVLYYLPKNHSRYNLWVYGADIIDECKDRAPEYYWLCCDGTLNMPAVYPIVDFYVRPSRWDGEPRMIAECEVYDIPYYYSEDGKPNVDDILNAIEKARLETSFPESKLC
jgi:hypothetical protein